VEWGDREGKRDDRAEKENDLVTVPLQLTNE